jgi:hypothetical protein
MQVHIVLTQIEGCHDMWMHAARQTTRPQGADAGWCNTSSYKFGTPGVNGTLDAHGGTLPRQVWELSSSDGQGRHGGGAAARCSWRSYGRVGICQGRLRTPGRGRAGVGQAEDSRRPMKYGWAPATGRDIIGSYLGETNRILIYIPNKHKRGGRTIGDA